MKAIDKLRVTWCKRDNDLIYHYPLGVQTKCDDGFLSGVINMNFAKELSKRGYDIKTLKFSIEPQKGDEKFASQRD